MNKVAEKKAPMNIPILHLTLYFALIYLLWWGMEIIINSAANNFQADYFSLIKLLVLGLASQLGLNISPILIFCKLKNLNIRKILRLNPVSKEQFLISFILFACFNGIALFLDNSMDMILGWLGLGYKMNNYILAKDISTLVILILIAGILTPICEELFYRGFLLGCTERVGTKLSIIYSAICFTIMHTNPYRISSLFIYSVFIGLIVYYTNSTLPGIMFHILTNTIYEAGSYFSRGDFVTSSIISENNKGTTFMSTKLTIYGIIFLICSMISLISIKRLKNIWIASNKVNVKKEAHLDKEPSQKTAYLLSVVILIILFIVKVSLYN